MLLVLKHSSSPSACQQLPSCMNQVQESDRGLAAETKETASETIQMREYVGSCVAKLPVGACLCLLAVHLMHNQAGFCPAGEAESRQSHERTQSDTICAFSGNQ